MTKLDIDQIENLLHYFFKDSDLLRLAFTHPSYYNEHRKDGIGHNERLEFLGDSVLSLLVSRYLYSHLPMKSEGCLSHLRSQIVGADACVVYTKMLKVEPFLLLGKGESENIGRGRERILADLFEAIIGAIFLDSGLEGSCDFFFNHFSSYIDNVMQNPFRNWKAELQDYSQKKTQKPPEYHIISESGPSHQRNFLIATCIEGVEIGRGEGASKKEAEQAAAENAMKNIEKEEMGGES